MEKYIDQLQSTKLFSCVDKDDIRAMLNCMQAQVRHYRKGEYIFRHGEHIDSIYILLEGAVLIQNDDYWGNRTIINEVSPLQMFGESYSTSGSDTVLSDAVTTSNSVVATFNVSRLMTVCSSACRFHSMVIQNLMVAISHKNLTLMQKLSHMSKRTTREKLISYLSAQSTLHNSSSFAIPFNRQQLADFLSVDRSAMSNELCKMRDDGLIEFEKNRFTLL